MSNKDFYICYNDADKPWADWIGWQLEAANYKVWTPDWDIRAGNNEVEAINKALEDSDSQKIERRMIVILSPHFTGTSVQENVWTSINQKDPDGTKGLLIPVIVSQPEPANKIPKVIKRIDLSIFNDEISMTQQLLNELSNGRNKPFKPIFPRKGSTNKLDKPDFPSEVSMSSLQQNNETRRPDFLLGLLDRRQLQDHFVKHIEKNRCIKNGKTKGFVVSGPHIEWPLAVCFKLTYVLEEDLIGDRNSSTELIRLGADKSILNREPEQFLWELLGPELKCEAEKEKIGNALVKRDKCHIFYRELPSEEANNHEFLTGIITAWSEITLNAHSFSHFLLLIRETSNVEKQKYRLPFRKNTETWRQQMKKSLNNEDLEEALLPVLTKADFEQDINDWMKFHDEERLRGSIQKELLKKIKKSSSISHAEFKKILLPVMHKIQS